MKPGKATRVYVITIGIVVNVVFLGVIGNIAAEKLTTNWRWKEIVRKVTGPVDSHDVFYIQPVNTGIINSNYFKLPLNTWIKIHQQKADDPVHFKRQRHAGSAFDSIRARMIIFGSDTHGVDWSNQLRIFDFASVRWIETTDMDDFRYYTVDASGEPIAKSGLIRPWAMHTFDAIDYDRLKDRLFVASFPKHMVPGRFGNWLETIWSKIKNHPTWLYDFQKSEWIKGKGNSVAFFPYSTAYDTNTGQFIGFRPDGIFSYTDERGWVKIGEKSVNAYHTNAVYDSINNAFVIFGTNTLSNAIHVFRYGDTQTQEQLTPGKRPPGTQSSPLAFHPVIEKTVALVDAPDGEDGGAQTWLYDLTTDSWTKLETAGFPFKLGMNYNMQYDNLHNQLVLIANAPDEFPSVWVLRL